MRPPDPNARFHPGDNPSVLAQIRVRPHTLSFQQGYSVMAANLDGELDGESDHGLYERNTRYLSRYIWRINHMPLQPIVVQPATHNAMLGYYTVRDREPLPSLTPIEENLLDIELSRFIGQGMHEDLLLINHGGNPLRFCLSLQLEVDFADVSEVNEQNRRQLGLMTRCWEEGEQTMHFTYAIDGVHHGLSIRFEKFGRPGQYEQGRLSWDIELPPRKSLHCCSIAAPVFCGEQLSPASGCFAFGHSGYESNSRRKAEAKWEQDSTRLKTSNPLVQRAYDMAKADLASMRLWEEDKGPDAWIPAAGLPTYVGVFGRDILTAGWQAGLMGKEMMQGAIAVMNRYQARETDDWRDEQPGKMVHEVRLGPLALLDLIPHRRYYGSTTSTPLYLIVLSELYHWTGDKTLLEQNREFITGALSWLDRYGDPDGDGFFEYKTRSSQGLKNQGWKDSDEGIVYADGTQVEAPIATCEEQAWVYEAKIRVSMMYAALKEFRQADRLINEAHQLKEQFNRAFWMPEENFYALALDSRKRQVTSITSNPGHCLVSGIVDEEKAGPVIGRMLSPDLFSGWGIRTLSSRHPSYTPYGYHLGTVWPVENGTFCLAFVRYGFYRHAALLAESMFAASALFEHGRLPEAISGHPRDRAHPFPSVYPRSNMPQAWSSSTIPMMIQAMLGLYPFAPLNMLFLDPHLPEWLPDLTLHQLRVGNARVSLHFQRNAEGHTEYRVLEKQGPLRILPHWVNIHTFHRLKDFGESRIARG